MTTTCHTRILVLTLALLLIAGCTPAGKPAPEPKSAPKVEGTATPAVKAPVVPPQDPILREAIQRTFAVDTTIPLNASLRSADPSQPANQAYLDFQGSQTLLTAHLWLPESADRLLVVIPPKGSTSEAELRKWSALTDARTAVIVLPAPYSPERVDAPWGSMTAPEIDTLAVVDVRRMLDALSEAPQFATRSFAITGDAQGAPLALMVAAADSRIRAVALREIPASAPAEAAVPTTHAMLSLMPLIAPRPLLLQAARQGRDQIAQEITDLAAAAYDPKTVRWYDGESLPDQAREDAVTWLQQAWPETTAATP
ncbi:MAG: hypothetical protein GEEBNDBF_00703 [bacterium]|nr:hypothetical protein [bacterium]